MAEIKEPTNSTDNEPLDKDPLYYRAKASTTVGTIPGEGGISDELYNRLDEKKADKDHEHDPDDIIETDDKQFVSSADKNRWDSGPLYTKEMPTWIGHGGINKGTTFINRTAQQMFDDILYPDMKPTIVNATIEYSGVSDNCIEEGGSGTVILATVTVEKNTRIITKISLMRGTSIIAEISDDTIADGGYFTLRPTSDTSFIGACTHKIRVTDESGAYTDYVFPAIVEITPIYYGSFDANSLVASQATQLNKLVAGKSDQIMRVSSSNNPIFICYPESYGKPSKISDSSEHDLTEVLNSYNINISGTMYKVYQSDRVTVHDLYIKIEW